jgi:hypothetical protein
MATKQELEAGFQELKSAIAAERAEVQIAVEVLTGKIDELTVKLTEGVDYADQLAEVKDAVNSVKSIFVAQPEAVPSAPVFTPIEVPPAL